jgi:hypothetical protein
MQSLISLQSHWAWFYALVNQFQMAPESEKAFGIS